jgi:hypothetical protein
MPNRADNTVSSTQVIPAGHPALTAEDELGEHASPRLTGLVPTERGCTWRRVRRYRDKPGLYFSRVL